MNQPTAVSEAPDMATVESGDSAAEGGRMSG